MDKVILEAYTQILESAKIEGVALIPTISRNHNLYTKQELARFDGVTVPLNWEHDSNKVIGNATFHYNPESETVYYDGEITDPSASLLAKNKLLYTSIEATPVSVQHVCNGTNDCFSMPFGLKPEALALTETPGILQTSVNLVEHYIQECNDPHLHKTLVRNQETGKLEEVPHEHESLDSADNIMQGMMQDETKALEDAIENKGKILNVVKKAYEETNESMLGNMIQMIENDIATFTNKLIALRKGTEFINIEHTLGCIANNLEESYVCGSCGDLKKNHISLKKTNLIKI